jgi:hypothetical protein
MDPRRELAFVDHLQRSWFVGAPRGRERRGRRVSAGGGTRRAPGMTTVACQMSDKLKARLDRIAAENDVKNLSWVIRRACEEYADRHERSAA